MHLHWRTLKHTAINLGDLEFLHIALPSLKKLTPDSVYQTERNDIIVKDPAQHIQLFSIRIGPRGGGFGEAVQSDAVIRWLSYIQEKYKCVNKLTLTANCGLWVNHFFHQPVIRAIKSMNKNLDSYIMDIYPQFTDNILRLWKVMGFI